MKIHEWQEQVMSQQASGLTAPQWCAENGVNYKTYGILVIIKSHKREIAKALILSIE